MGNTPYTQSETNKKEASCTERENVPGLACFSIFGYFRCKDNKIFSNITH